MKFSRENESLKPISKRQEDAGYDFYPYFSEDEVIIMPNTTKIINTGIRTAFSNDKVLMLKERSSTWNTGISIGAGIIDSGYRGTIGVVISNISDKVFVISKLVEEKTITENEVLYPYSKAICQGLLLSLAGDTITEVDKDKILSLSSERGEGKEGSTSK